MPQNPKIQSNPTNEDDVIDLGALFNVIWRQKWSIFVIIILFVLVGAFYAFKVATPKYQATSVILLDTSSQQLLDLGAILPSLGTESDAINTELEVLKSRRLIQRVVNAANLIQDPEFNDSLKPPSLTSKVKQFLLGTTLEYLDAEEQETIAITNVLEQMFVHNVPNTYVLQVTIETGDAKKSANLADTIAEQYILYQMDVKFDATREASQWLTSRVADLKQELEQAEAKVSEFSTNSDAVSIESVLALDTQLKALRDRLETSRETSDAAELRLNELAALQNLSAQEKAEGAKDARLTKLLLEDEQRNAFEEQFAQLLASAQLQAERSSVQVRSLILSIATQEAEIAKQSNEIIQLQQLSREAEASRLLYEYFLGRLKETSAQEGIQQADSRILSNAILTKKPTEPRKVLIFAMSIIFGTFVGCGAVLLWELRQNSYRQASDLEHDTGLIVMGQIPLLPTGKRREGLNYLTKKPTSAAAEAVRNLRTSILLSSPHKVPKVIMSTSSLPGEGKTTISFALAQNLVGLGKKVLLVEGDIRRLVFSQYLDVTNIKGLMSLLSNEISLKDAVTYDPLLGADILVSEASSLNAADILSSQAFVEFIETARTEYDFVIIDTPPVLVVPDARVVAQHVDTILFTVHWDKTTKSQVRNALHMFESIDTPISGLVLNQIDPKGMKKYGYGDSYGAYGSYGSKYYTN